MTRKRGKYFVGAVIVLSFLLIRLNVHAWTQPSLGREVEAGLVEAFKENPEYVSVSAEYDCVRKQRDVFQKKLIDRDPELRRLLQEREKLQRTISTLKTDRLENEEIRRYEAQWFSVNQAMNSRLSKFREYAVLSFHCNTLFMKENLIKNRIIFTSSDKRILKYREAMERESSKSSVNLTENLPKADVEGSDEYRFIMYLMITHKNNPQLRMLPLQNGCFVLRCKVDRIAEKEAALRKLQQKITLKCMELGWKHCLLQEKNPELAWKVDIALKSIDEKNPETTRVYRNLEDEMLRIFRADAEYAGLEKEKRELQEEYQKALDDFAAKSNVQEAVEYRKVMAMLDEMKQTSSGKTK